MKSSACLALIFCSVAITATTTDNFQLFNECDNTVSKGVAVCFQTFNPIRFVSDLFFGNKDSLCCTHFKHNACIRGVKDAVRVAKSANLCPNSFSDKVISTLTESSINSYIIRSCKSFSVSNCVMDSVGDVVNTIQGFFTPQQQKPVLPQVIENIFNSRENRDKNLDNTPVYNSNVNNDRSSLFDTFREVKTSITTENPLINKSIKDLLNRQYIPEASAVKPVSDLFTERPDISSNENQFKSLFNGIISPRNQRNPKASNEPSIFDTISSQITGILSSESNESPSILRSFGDLFQTNSTDDESTIVSDIARAVNRN